MCARRAPDLDRLRSQPSTPVVSFVGSFAFCAGQPPPVFSIFSPTGASPLVAEVVFIHGSCLQRACQNRSLSLNQFRFVEIFLVSFFQFFCFLLLHAPFVLLSPLHLDRPSHPTAQSALQFSTQNTMTTSR